MHWIRLTTDFKRNLASRRFCFFCCQKKEPLGGGEPIRNFIVSWRHEAKQILVKNKLLWQ